MEQYGARGFFLFSFLYIKCHVGEGTPFVPRVVWNLILPWVFHSNKGILHISSRVGLCVFICLFIYLHTPRCVLRELKAMPSSCLCRGRDSAPGSRDGAGWRHRGTTAGPSGATSVPRHRAEDGVQTAPGYPQEETPQPLCSG